MPARQPVVSAGDRVPAKRDEIEDLPERDRDHGEIDAAPPYDNGADQRRRDRRGSDADRHADQVFGAMYFIAIAVP